MLPSVFCYEPDEGGVISELQVFVRLMTGGAAVGIQGDFKFRARLRTMAEVKFFLCYQ